MRRFEFGGVNYPLGEEFTDSEVNIFIHEYTSVH